MSQAFRHLRFLPLGCRIILLADAGFFCAQVDSREELEQSQDSVRAIFREVEIKPWILLEIELRSSLLIKWQNLFKKGYVSLERKLSRATKEKAYLLLTRAYRKELYILNFDWWIPNYYSHSIEFLLEELHCRRLVCEFWLCESYSGIFSLKTAAQCQLFLIFFVIMKTLNFEIAGVSCRWNSLRIFSQIDTWYHFVLYVKPNLS